MPEWRFPSNDYGEKKGINDSGVAMFRGTPLRSLAREICQNSLDAARAKTICVEFNAFDIPKNDLPGYEALKDTFKRCAEFWNDQKATATKAFFENAQKKINEEKIHMLRISDFFTSGLTGSKEEINTDWTNLTKSSGVSDKKGAAGGSYGIGKYAPFACSDFSTVYYSTYDEENVKASQGVSRLVTFRRSDDQTTQGVGYYGEERNTPTFKTLNIDPGFSRGEQQYGTDIYIAGYKHFAEEGGWEKAIIISVLDSFLGAIWNEKMVVKVGSVFINKETLPEMIENYKEELSGYTEKYYEVLTSSSTKWHTEDFNGLGEIKLGLLLASQGTEMHRKVAMIRQTGMKIKDQDRISSFVPFAGVMFINGEKINKELRQLENPEHTEWQIARADNEIKAKALLKALNDFIKKKVEELASQNSQEDFDAAGLGALLPDDPSASKEQAKEETVADKTLEVRKTTIKKRTSKGKDKKGDEDKAAHSEGDIKDKGYVEGNDVLGYIHKDRKVKDHTIHRDPYMVGIDKGKEFALEEEKTIDIIPEKLRVVCMDKKNGKYAVMFTPKTEGKNGTIHLELSAESGSYPAPIASASIVGKGNLSVEDSNIKGVDFKKDEVVRLMIQLDYSDYCSMEVRAYADKE